MPDLLPFLADFLATAQGAYPDLDVLSGESCVHLRWGSHALTAWVDVYNGDGTMTITHDEGGHEADGGPDPLAAVARLIVEHINEVGTACGEGPDDSEPGTFAARVWVVRYQTKIADAEEWIARLDPEGRYSAQSAPSSISLADFAKALDPDDTLF